jgi:hypothetical protein
MLLTESRRMIVFEGRRYASEGGPERITVPCRTSSSGEPFASSLPVSALM